MDAPRARVHQHLACLHPSPQCSILWAIVPASGFSWGEESVLSIIFLAKGRVVVSPRPLLLWRKTFYSIFRLAASTFSANLAHSGRKIRTSHHAQGSSVVVGGEGVRKSGGWLVWSWCSESCKKQRGATLHLSMIVIAIYSFHKNL